MPKRVAPEPLPEQPLLERRRVATILNAARRVVPVGVNREFVLRRALQRASHEVAVAVGAQIPHTTAMSVFEAYRQRLLELAAPLNPGEKVLEVHHEELLRLALSLEKEINALALVPHASVLDGFGQNNAGKDGASDILARIGVSNIKPGFNALDKAFFHINRDESPAHRKRWIASTFGRVDLNAVLKLWDLSDSHNWRKKGYRDAFNATERTRAAILDRHLGGKFDAYSHGMAVLETEFRRRLGINGAGEEKNP